ncbi:MAG: SRPBCC family protein [Bacteroidia bacterium]
MHTHHLHLLILACLLPAGLRAGVIDSSATGFTILHEASIDARATDVYRAITRDWGGWWDSNHSFSGDAANFRMDTRPGGGLYERLPDGGFVEHLHLVHLVPNRLIRLQGGLGPLTELGLHGVLSFDIQTTETGCTLRLTYIVHGYLPGGVQSIASPVDGVLSLQVRRLKRYVEQSKYK